MSWAEHRLGDIVKFRSGGTPSKSEPRYWDGDIPWLSSKDLTEARIYDAPLRVTELGAENGTRLMPENTVMFVVRGMSLATEFRVSITRRPCTFNQDLKAVECGELILPDFLFYSLFARRVRIKGLAGEASHGTKKLESHAIENITVLLPSLEIQRRVIEVASAYDDLIENNRRRIALLEEAARTLYREWFVRFRFPGHEHVKLIDGVPDGWERRTLADVAADISYGYTESASHDVEGPKFLRITDIVDGPIQWGNVPRCPIAEEKLQRFLLLSEDVVVARTGATTGWARRVGRLSEPAVFASYLVRFRFSARYRSELAATYMQSDAYKAFVRGNLGGAAQPNANAKVLASAPVVVPAGALQVYFSENVAPMFEQIDALMDQNRKLAQARDLLLPSVMNGEIAV